MRWEPKAPGTLGADQYCTEVRAELILIAMGAATLDPICGKTTIKPGTLLRNSITCARSAMRSGTSKVP